MASSSKSRIQTSPPQTQLFSLLKGSSMLDMPDYHWFHENFETQTSLSNPCLLYPFELGIARSNRKLIVGYFPISETERFPRLQNRCREIRSIEKHPCEFSEFFQRGVSGGEQESTFQATMANQTSRTHELHLPSGCFCQGAKRQIAASERPPVLYDIIIGMEGDETLLNSCNDQFMRMSGIHRYNQYNHRSAHIPAWVFSSEVYSMSLADQASNRHQCFHIHQIVQEHIADSLFSQAVAKHWSVVSAVRLFHQDSYGVPSINEITAISSRLCGQISSLPSHASLLSSDTSELRSSQTSLDGDNDIHSQFVDHNSARLTETSPSPAYSVLNITPSANYGSSSESTSASFSPESTRDVETQHRIPLSTESRAEEPLLNRSRLTETFLVISTQVAVTLLTVRYGSSSSMSTNAKILLYSSAACNVIGFVCCLLGILVCGRDRPPGAAARVATGMGYISTVYGFAAIMGMLLSDNLKLRITGAACIASFPALAFAFMK